MASRHKAAWIIGASTAALVAGCGGGGSSGDASVAGYLQGLPRWEEFSPPGEEQSPTPVGHAADTYEQVETPLTSGTGTTSQQYVCKHTTFSMQDTPEKIVMFSPDREIVWPGALIQGKSHADQLGSLVGLPIRERAPIKVSIPSLATGGNFRVVEVPDQATVNSAIGEMVAEATASGLAPPSSIEFTMRDYKSEKSFALQASISGKYMGFRASASGAVETAANERTVMVHFVEKMFEVVVEPPQTPEEFFSDAFTQARLDEQVALGRMGPTNLPVYVSNVVYGRMMAFTFTSTASLADIKAALSAAYKGTVEIEGGVKSDYKRTLSEGRISITSIGGPSAATAEMIASGDWRSYFGQPAPLTTAYPISYTFRNLGDGSIAKVTEADSYDVKECTPAGGAGFVLESFESGESSLWDAVAASPQLAQQPVEVAWRSAAEPQAVFYGFEAVTHSNNTVDDQDWIYDVGYIAAPSQFLGNLSSYFGGGLSFWYRPGERMHVQQPSFEDYCYTHWIWYVPPIWERICTSRPVVRAADFALQASDRVYVNDDQSTADQIVLRGGGDEDLGAMLTLTYNPPLAERSISQGWQKLELPLTNLDNAGLLLCDPAEPQGCWMVEDRIATEAEIQYVLSDLRQFRIRASYPVYRTETCDTVVPEGKACPHYTPLDAPVPLGYVGGYFDEIKLTKSVR